MAEHDEAMDRLRTSDPAMGSHPDLHSLRALVAQKAPASQGSDEVTRLHDDPLRAPRAVGPWIAAAAVAAIGMGGGGYALGAHQAEPPPVAGGTVTVDPGSSARDSGADDSAPVDVDPPEGGPDEGAGGDGVDGEPGLAPGMDTGMGSEMGTGMGEDEAMAHEDAAGGEMAYDPGPVRLVAGEGLPTGPGTGEVRALGSDRDPAELVDSLAEALGMDPTEIPQDDEWTYYPHGVVDPASGEVIQAGLDGGPLTFHYESLFTSEWCTTMFDGYEEEDLMWVREDWERSYGPDMPLPGPESCRTPEGPAPTEDEARAMAADFFALVGVDTSGYTVEVYADESQSSVNLDYWPEDMEYGQLNLSAVVGPEGVTSAYGTIGEFSSLGDYPVITAAEAVDRYATREWSMDHHVSIPEDYSPYPMGEELSMPVYDLPEPATLSPGDPIPVLMKDKTVTGAELVQGTLYTTNSGVLEVPVWKLLTADGMHYPVLALAEEALDYQSWE